MRPDGPGKFPRIADPFHCPRWCYVRRFGPSLVRALDAARRFETPNFHNSTVNKEQSRLLRAKRLMPLYSVQQESRSIALHIIGYERTQHLYLQTLIEITLSLICCWTCRTFDPFVADQTHLRLRLLVFISSGTIPFRKPHLEGHEDFTMKPLYLGLYCWCHWGVS